MGISALLAWLAHAVAAGIALWWGRSLRVTDNPMLREQWLAYLGRVYFLFFVTFAGAVFCAAVSPLWVFGLILLLQLVLFPTRRRVFEEKWSLLRYLHFQARYVLMFGVFWLCIGLLPAFIHALPLPLMASTVFAGGLALGLIWAWPRYSMALIGAQPWPEALLWPGCEQVLAQARCTRPEILVARDQGGRFANAFALPSLKTPRVVFGHNLVAESTPAELTAILGHEVAHLEQFDAAYLRRWSFVSNLLLILATILVPAVAIVAPHSTDVAVRLWSALVVVGWSRFVISRNKQEADADLRALQLGVDGDAFITALIKLHELSHQPRRADADAENMRSHPSLARRIKAVRQHMRSEGGAAMPETPSALAPFAVRDRKSPRRALFFEHSHLHFLHGVPDDVALDSPELMQRAKRNESFDYQALSSAVVQAHMGGPVLVILTNHRRRLQFALHAQAVPTVQAALDAIDARFSSLLPTVPADRFARWIMFGISLALCSVTRMLDLPYVLYGLAVIGLCPVHAAHLRALAAGMLAALAFTTLRVASTPNLTAVVALLALSLAAEYAARRAVRQHGVAAPHSRLPLGLLLLPTLVLTVAALLLCTDRFSLHWTFARAGTLPVLAMVSAALLMGHTRRVARVGAAALAGVGLSALMASTGAFRDWVVRDPFLVTPAPLNVEDISGVGRQPELRRRSLSHRYELATMSPSAAWLVANELDADDQRLPNNYVLFDTDNRRQRIEARRLLLIDEQRALVVLQDRSRGWTLRGLRLDNMIEVESELVLPSLPDAELGDLVVEGERYRLSEHNQTLWREVSGQLGQAPDSERRARLELVDVSGAESQLPGLALRLLRQNPSIERWRSVAATLLGAPRAPQASPMLLFALSYAQQPQRLIAQTWLRPSCVERAAGSHQLLCMVHDRQSSVLFQLDSSSGAVMPLGRLSGVGFALQRDPYAAGRFSLQLGDALVFLQIDARGVRALSAQDRPGIARSGLFLPNAVTWIDKYESGSVLTLVPRGDWMEP